MKLEFLVRVIYAICLVGAGFNHLSTLLTHGLFWDYNNAPLFTRFFWTSLTFFDPIAELLLFLKPKLGLTLTFLIIFIDVLHNGWMLLLEERSLFNYMYISQFLFLIIVVLTIRIPWKVSLQQ